uniref:2-oxoglutarate (2OG) and Fe(II)-dependent oxygenase superfamily protein n=1 Tax=Tanacetum cinerariifolium TaxID=118510 RepID=A0A699HT80_TANCI|nr:2-oxoglutarate (2OG) and Fe(II)-dependent oxygenase superfamily protein [Tanacetum cinerariifolium]
MEGFPTNKFLLETCGEPVRGHKRAARWSLIHPRESQAVVIMWRIRIWSIGRSTDEAIKSSIYDLLPVMENYYTSLLSTGKKLSSLAAFIFNLGDMMKRWTNCIFRSTLHRVMPTGKERHSVILPN